MLYSQHNTACCPECGFANVEIQKIPKPLSMHCTRCGWDSFQSRKEQREAQNA